MTTRSRRPEPAPPGPRPFLLPYRVSRYLLYAASQVIAHPLPHGRGSAIDSEPRASASGLEPGAGINGAVYRSVGNFLVRKAIKPAAKGSRLAEGLHLAASAAENAPVAEAPDSQAQTRLFESAAGLFHAGNFLRAKPLFEQAARGPLREMAHSARVHVRMCERRSARHELSLRTADDLYGYAVALMNERRFQQAEHHLQRALT